VGITPTTLTANLKELEINGLVTRKAYATVPPTVEYSLTEMGHSVIPLAKQLREWGIMHLKGLGKEIDVEKC
jgi:DNA-binding HxlR family transcriptional regulator